MQSPLILTLAVQPLCQEDGIFIQIPLQCMLDGRLIAG